MKILLLILSIFQISVNLILESNAQKLSKVVKNLDNNYDFKNIVILSTDFGAEFSEHFINDLEKPIILIGMKEFTLKEIINKNTLIIVFYENLNSIFLKYFVNINLRGLRNLKTIFIDLKSSLWFRNQSQLLGNIFSRRGFWNSIHIHIENDSLKFGELIPFESKCGDIYNDLTDIPIQKWFGVKISRNLPNIKIKIPNEQNDIPRIFVFEKNGKRNIYGTSGRLFHVFLNHMNIKYDIFKMKPNWFSGSSLDFDAIKALIFNDTLDLTPYVHVAYPVDNEYLSYPLEILDWCLMVPFQKEIEKEIYIILPFRFHTWLTVLAGVVVIGISLMIISRLRNRKDIASFLQAMCLTMNFPSSRVKKPFWIDFAVYFALFIYGFIISNFYITLLASHLTIPAYPDQLETLEDIRKSKINVFIESGIYKTLLRSSELFQALEQMLNYQFLITLFSTFFLSSRNNFNTSLIYPVTNDVWEFLEMQQQFMQTPFFRLSKICFSQSYSSFLMKNDSPFEDHLNNFILVSKESGLFKYWKEESFRAAVSAGYASIRLDDIRRIPLDMDYFHGILIGMAYGFSTAGCVFVIEIILCCFGKTCKKKIGRHKTL